MSLPTFLGTSLRTSLPALPPSARSLSRSHNRFRSRLHVGAGCVLILGLGGLLGVGGISPEPAFAEESPKLLGTVQVEEFRQEPFREWFEEGYDAYVPNSVTLTTLKDLSQEDLEIAVYLGTWCGDSRREVPRIWKVLDEMGLPEEQRRLIALNNTGMLHKRSPDGAEVGQNIFRVPTVVVTRGGTEVARVVEYPQVSLEEDLLRILQGEGSDYRPSYRSFPTVVSWLESGRLADPNSSLDGMADEVRALVSSASELGSAARVLGARGQFQESAALHGVNCSLFWDSGDCHRRLAAAELKAGKGKSARRSVVRALQRDVDPDRVLSLLETWDKAGNLVADSSEEP